jgi:beta-lactamase class D
MIGLLFCALQSVGQPHLVKPFKECGVVGSTTIYDYKHKKWIFSNPADAEKPSLPASTFKIINLLIALETGVIEDENEVIQWPGSTDTTRYGYRPEIYRDMTVREAFEVSAVWVFLDLAKKIGRERYKHYLTLCQYGNADITENNPDFWNLGNLAITPRNQVELMIRIYEGKLPFSKKNLDILKRVMVTEQNGNYTIRSKTGWTRENHTDSGWWVGYVERTDNVWFFATRISKDRSVPNPSFGNCRKEITRNILRQLKAID